MATFRRLEDIAGWQKARELTKAIYLATARGALARDFGLKDQIRRASTSVMANVAEGFGRGGNREFVQFLAHARGSCTEVKSHLYVAADSGALPSDEFERLYRLASEAEGLISGLMRYLQRTAIRGQKFRTTSNAKPQTENSDA